jgi:hypothetical protein
MRQMSGISSPKLNQWVQEFILTPNLKWRWPRKIMNPTRSETDFGIDIQVELGLKCKLIETIQFRVLHKVRSTSEWISIAWYAISPSSRNPIYHKHVWDTLYHDIPSFFACRSVTILLFKLSVKSSKWFLSHYWLNSNMFEKWSLESKFLGKRGSPWNTEIDIFFYIFQKTCHRLGFW